MCKFSPLRLVGLFSAVAVLAGAAAPERPFRSSYVMINDALDRVKPLAPHDRSGWAMGADMLIGPYDDEWVVGYSMSGKRPMWWIPAPSPLAAPVTMLGSWVMLGYRDGKLAKVDAVSGKVAWETTVDSFVSRRSALAGAILVIVTARQQVYGIDFQTGATRWLYDPGAPENIVVQYAAAPLATADRVYVGTANGEIHALQTDSGKLLWATSPDIVEGRFHDVVGDIVLHGDRVIVSRYDGLVASLIVDEELPRVSWKEQLPTVTTSTYRNGRVYLGTLGGQVYAYNAGTGKIVWTAETGQTVAFLTATEEGILASGSQGRITYLDADQGKMRWHDDIAGAPTTPPLVVDKHVFVVSGMKAIYGYQVSR